MIVDVKLQEPEAFLRQVAAGEMPLAVALAVDADDLAALTRVGAAALAGGRHELAERVFAGLVALAPHERVHALHLAAVRHAAGNATGALDAVNEALADVVVDASVAHVAQPLVLEDHVDALLLRAELRGRSEPDAALADLAQARTLQRTLQQARSQARAQSPAQVPQKPKGAR